MELISIICLALILLTTIISLIVTIVKLNKLNKEVISVISGISSQVGGIKIPEYTPQKDTVISKSDFIDLCYEAVRSGNNTLTLSDVILMEPLSMADTASVASTTLADSPFKLNVVFNNCKFVNMKQMFTYVPFISLTFNKCKFMGSMASMFSMSRNWENNRDVNPFLTSLVFNNCDTSEVTSLNNTFSNLAHIKSLDISCFDVSNVVDIVHCFTYCHALETLKLPKKFVHSKITNLGGFCSSCNALKELNMSDFDTSKVTNYGYFLYPTPALKKVDLSSFMFSNAMGDNTSKIILDEHAEEVKLNSKYANKSNETLYIMSEDGKKKLVTRVPKDKVKTV